MQKKIEEIISTYYGAAENTHKNKVVVQELKKVIMNEFNDFDLKATNIELGRFFQEIMYECIKQDEKWGKNRSHHPLEWYSILMEEIGEIPREFNDNDFARALPANYNLELIQSATVLFRMWVQNIKDNHEAASEDNSNFH